MHTYIHINVCNYLYLGSNNLVISNSHTNSILRSTLPPSPNAPLVSVLGEGLFYESIQKPSSRRCICHPMALCLFNTLVSSSHASSGFILEFAF